MKKNKLSVCEMWYKDVSENYKELCEQAEYENLLIVARLMPIDTYELGKERLNEYYRYLNKYFKLGGKNDDNRTPF